MQVLFNIAPMSENLTENVLAEYINSQRSERQSLQKAALSQARAEMETMV